ncbi:MAG: PorV/PorQ family protein [Elusimicrobiota bacterium]
MICRSYAVILTGVETGADFLTYGIGARPSAMGESYVAACYDVTATYWNPAGLSKIDEIEFGAMHSEASPTTTLAFFGIAMPMPRLAGVFGMNAILLIYDTEPIINAYGEYMGDLTWLDWAMTLSFGKKIYSGLSCGAGLKIIQRRESDPYFGDTKGTAYAADVGFLYEFHGIPGLSLGTSYLNFGDRIQMEGEKRKDVLPETLKIGFAYKTGTMLFITDVNRIVRDRFRISLGAELETIDILRLRTGFYDRGGNIKGMTYGLGIILDNFSIDWANLPAGEMIGYSKENRVSVTIRF